MSETRKVPRFVDQLRSEDAVRTRKREHLVDDVRSDDEYRSSLFHRLTDEVVIYEGLFKVSTRSQGEENFSLHYESRNLITDRGRKILPHLISTGCTPGFGPLNYMKIGGKDVTQADAEYLLPNPPTPLDTDIVYLDYIADVRPGDLTAEGFPRWEDPEFPFAPFETSVVFEFRFGYESANREGFEITPYLAAGIFHDTGSEQILFCTNTFPALEKKRTREIFFQWEIVFR